MNKFPWRAPVVGWLANVLGTAVITFIGCTLYGKWTNWRMLYLVMFLMFSCFGLVTVFRLGWRQTTAFAALSGATALASLGAVIWCWP